MVKMARTKEQVYDEEIYPLMDKIVKICVEHEIPTLCTFALGDGRKCTTALSKQGWDTPPVMLLAMKMILQGQVIDPPK